MKIESISNITSNKETLDFVKNKDSISNEVFLVNKKYIFRHNLEKKFYVFNNEKKIINDLKQYQISEEVIDINEQFKLSKKIPYIHTLKENEKDFEHLSKVIDNLKIIHSLSTKGYMKYDSFTYIRYYYRKIKNMDKFDGNEYKNAINVAKYIFHKYKPVVCHNDLVKGNILFNKDRCYLIDYEYAGLNCPIFDLASLFSENNISDTKLIRELINYYDPNIPESDVFVTMNYLDIYWYMWAKYNYELTKKEIFKTIADDKLESFKTPLFKRL